MNCLQETEPQRGLAAEYDIPSIRGFPIQTILSNRPMLRMLPELVILRDGIARVYRIRDSQRFLLEEAHSPSIIGEDVFVEELEDVAPLSIDPLTSCRVQVIPKEDMLEIVKRDTGFGRAFLGIVRQRILDRNDLVQSVWFHSVKSRVAQVLCSKAGNAAVIPRVTQQAIGEEALGSRESVAKTFLELERDGVLRVDRNRAPSVITIVERGKLEELAAKRKKGTPASPPWLTG